MKGAMTDYFLLEKIEYFYAKSLLMETLIIRLKTDKARKLIQDLEDLEILKVIDKPYLRRQSENSKISELKNKIATPMKDDAINRQLEQIRNEWQPNI
jgi:hypothetical protein